MSRRYFPLICLCVLTCLAADVPTQPDASAYPALQKLLTKLETQVGTLQASNAALAKENESLMQQIADLQPKPKVRPAHVPNDGQPHPDALDVGMTLDDAVDLTGEGNLAAFRKSSASSAYTVYSWSTPSADPTSLRTVWGGIVFGPDGKITRITKGSDHASRGPIIP